jgi:rhomboid protease GluP
MSSRERTSLLCPNCRKLISADEPACPYCGLSRPGTRNFFLGGFNNLSLDITKIIVYLNGGFFILSLLLSVTNIGMSANPFTLLSPSQEGLFILGATGTLPIGSFGRWWTLISASFLHGSLMHIFFNMMALLQMGPFVVQEYGLNRFVIIYTLTGIAGFLLSYLAGVPFTIGASACICGLIGAIIYYGKARGGHYGDAIYRQALGWVVGLVIYGLLFPGINNWAHGGGVASGILCAWWLGYLEERRETILHKTLSQGCIVLTCLVLLFVIFQTAYVYLFL